MVESSAGSLAREAAQQFRDRFGRSPDWVVAAPGRVNLIGDHTDHNGGFVLPMAIEQHTVIAAGRRSETVDRTIVDPSLVDTTIVDPTTVDPTFVAHSLTLDEEDTFTVDLENLKPSGKWTDYIRGVLAEFLDRGMTPKSLDLVVGSNVPMGCGLSSSAALQIAAARLLQQLSPALVRDEEIPALCQTAEHKFAGVPVGIMDQFCIANARENHVLLLDCQSLHAKHILFDDENVAVLIVDSHVSRELRSGAYAERRRECEAACQVLGVKELRDADLASVQQAREALGDVSYRRARHVTSENARTLEAAEAIGARNWARFGELMYESHDSLRDDFEVSCQEIDTLVSLAAKSGTAGGVFGARITGGGFGGCAVALIETAKAGEIIAELSAGYRNATGNELSAYVSSPAAGVRILDEHEWRLP